MPAIRILYFASVAERLGMREEVYPLPVSLSIEGLKRFLSEKHPLLKEPLQHCRIALNQEFVEGNPMLRPGDEVAIIPPVSGG